MPVEVACATCGKIVSLRPWFAARWATHYCSKRCQGDAQKLNPKCPHTVRPLAERFWEKVKRGAPNECWEWLGGKTKDGYGRIGLGDPLGDGHRSANAHRVAWELTKGPIPEGLHLDHLCRNRGCVNPAHLEPVTSAENVRRGQAPAIIAHMSSRCYKGHPLVPGNVYLEKTPRGTIGQRCRICRLAWTRAANAEKRRARKAA